MKYTMRTTKLLSTAIMALLLAGTFASCKKTSVDVAAADVLTEAETSLVAAAGFNSAWVDKRGEDSYLIEGDILLTKAQLQEMVGESPAHNFIVGNEEHYRTNNVVSTPTTGSRV